MQDWGPGFANADPERVFDAFYNIKPGGLGMGLSICRSLIEAHRARFRATAAPGRHLQLQPACNPIRVTMASETV